MHSTSRANDPHLHTHTLTFNMTQTGAGPRAVFNDPISGKHKGLLFSEVPKDYLEWLLGTELDEDMAHTVRHHLAKA